MSERFSRIWQDPLGSAAWLLEGAMRNYAGAWPFYLALLLALGVVIAAGGGWRHYAQRPVLTDIAYAIAELSYLQGLVFLVPLTIGANYAVDRAFPGLRNIGVGVAPPWLLLLTGFVVVDFCGYWLHRLKHTSPWLWQFHKVHHAQTHLSVFTRFRFPMLDRALDILLLLPVAIFTGSTTLPVSLYIFVALRSALEHSGLNTDYGPLRRVIVSPLYHATHHSLAPEHRDRNFANFLPLWDHLFGTYAAPGDAPLRYGLASETIKDGFWHGQIAPLIGIAKLRAERTPLLAGLRATRKARGMAGVK